MFIKSEIGFNNTTALPIVGSCVNYDVPNCLKTAVYESTAQLVAGDPLVVEVSKASQSSDPLNGWNPGYQRITKKATTATSGANTTNVCGFLIVNSNDRVVSGGVGVPVQGNSVMYAPLGQGALIWLEVASNNVAGFNKVLDTNTPITIDSANGGVKVGSGTDILTGAKVIQGVTDALKIKQANGSYSLTACKAILVQLS